MNLLKTEFFRLFSRWIIGFISVALLAWVIWKQDWTAFGNLITSQRGWLILAAGIASMLLVQVFAALRWLILLRIENPTYPFRNALRLTLIGAFTSFFLPTTTGGDIVRIVGLTDRSRAAGVAIVAIDRIVSLSGMVLLIPVSIPTISAPLIKTNSISPLLKSFLEDLKQNLIVWRKYPGTLAKALFLALGSFAWGWITVWIFAKGLNLEVNYWQIVGAGVWIYMAGLLPIAINGLGIQEAGYVYFYGLLGVTPALAATLGLLIRLTYLLSVSSGGIWLAFSPEIVKSIQGRHKSLS